LSSMSQTRVQKVMDGERKKMFGHHIGWIYQQSLRCMISANVAARKEFAKQTDVVVTERDKLAL
jgi:hypothetical protein